MHASQGFDRVAEEFRGEVSVGMDEFQENLLQEGGDLRVPEFVSVDVPGLDGTMCSESDEGKMDQELEAMRTRIRSLQHLQRSLKHEARRMNDQLADYTSLKA